MHELSVAQALLSQVAEIAQAQGAVAVERIAIEVGPLCGTEPSLLSRAFVALRCGVAADAELSIEHSGVSVHCLQCESRTETPANRLICGTCGGWRTRVVSGDELRLLRVELRMPGPLARAGSTVERLAYV